MTVAHDDAALGGRAPTGTSAGFVLTGRPLPIRVLVQDLWNSRDLIKVLSRRSFFTRYRRAAFGYAWAVGLPLIQAIVMAAVFHFAVRINTPHYPVFLFSGLFAWSFFNSAVTGGSTSIVDNSGLSSRIYFPRLVLPIISVAGNLYNFIATIGVLLIAAGIFGVAPGLHTLYLVPAVALVLLLAITMSAVLAALHVYFRDIRFIVLASLTAWFYLTPVFYPLHFLSDKHAPLALRIVVDANPATGVVEFFRAAVTGADPVWPREVGISCAWTFGLLLLALWMHRRYDRLLTDLL